MKNVLLFQNLSKTSLKEHIDVKRTVILWKERSKIIVEIRTECILFNKKSLQTSCVFVFILATYEREIQFRIDPSHEIMSIAHSACAPTFWLAKMRENRVVLYMVNASTSSR